ncbi:MAG: N-acetyl sugar amidotransferase, partial [Geminicoccaceae bacterium]
LKFGIGRATSDAAHEIRDGELIRDEALALVEKYDDEHPRESPHFAECLEYLDIGEEQYERVEERFRKALS